MNTLIKLIISTYSYKIRKKILLLKLSPIFLISPQILVLILRSYFDFEGLSAAYKISGLQKNKVDLIFEK